MFAVGIRMAIFVASVGGALAQDSASHTHAHTAQPLDLPQACRTGTARAMPGMETLHSMMDKMGPHQRAFMEGMMQTEGPMMRGMMADDADIAFACAMIPHHQGAINMAQAELEHGDSDEMKQLAQKIIDDQKREIEQLTKWINQQAQ